VRAAARTFNRMQERLRRLIDDRTQLAAAIAHDLGTPITRLRLRAEDIENEEQRAKFLEDLAQMQRMIGATLDFARQEPVVEPLETIDLSSLLQSICDDFADMHCDVTLTAPSRTRARLRPLAVRRAVTNIIENALKYGKRADVRLAETAAGYSITVDDLGPGIPELLKAEAVKPFRRLEADGQGQVPGTGLGLTTARAIARDHGGDLDLINRAEGGLRVQVTLPRISAIGSP
jgi:signal transduction histidine kinase